MSYTAGDWRKAITKLLELTSSNQINWTRSDMYTGDAWAVVDDSYKAKFNDKTYVVSKTRSKHYLDDTEFTWDRSFNLSIFEWNGYEFSQIASSPSISATSTLFDAAERNFSYNRKALDDLLG